MDVPESLHQKIQLFRSKGRVLRWQEDLFTEDSWIAVMLGQGIVPSGYDPLVDSLPLEKLRQFVRHIKDVVAKTAQAMPTHENFITRLRDAASLSE
jgi:tryptophan halogenase